MSVNRLPRDATPDGSKPWVLLRKGQAAVRFASLAEAQSIYDMLRRSGTARVPAAIVGPDRERWRCNPWRWAYWIRDDRPAPGSVEAEEPEDAA